MAHREDLNASQRAMIAAELTTDRQGRPRKEGRRDVGGRLLPEAKNPRRPLVRETQTGGLSQILAGKLLNVSARLVGDALYVRKSGVPELLDSICHGETSVSTAREIAALPAAQQRRVLADGGRKVVAIARQHRDERLGARRIDRARAAEASPLFRTFGRVCKKIARKRRRRLNQMVPGRRCLAAHKNSM